MNEWMCDECKHRDEPAYSMPCYACVDGDEFEPEERSEDNEQIQDDH